MQIISEETVVRANQRMMECKVERETADSVSHNVFVSVIANGRVYKQEVTDREMRKAFEKALKSSNAVVSPSDDSSAIVRIKGSCLQKILGRNGQMKSKVLKRTHHARRI